MDGYRLTPAFGPFARAGLIWRSETPPTSSLEWETHRMSDEPRTVWEERTDLGYGGRAMVRAAAFPVGEGVRGGVTLTCLVPDGFFTPIDGGGASATSLIGSDEARRLARWLIEAAAQADEIGLPIYDG